MPKEPIQKPVFDDDTKRQRWNALVEAGRNDTDDEENIRWRHGDRAAEVCTLWSSEAPLIAFGAEIGLSHPSRIYEFYQTSVTFPPAARELIKEELMGITWSHCNVAAARAKKIKAAPETAYAWIVRAHDNNWNVQTFRKQLKDIDSDWVEHRNYFPAELTELRVVGEKDQQGYVTLKIKADKVDTLRQLQTQQDFVVDLRVTYKLLVLKDT